MSYWVTLADGRAGCVERDSGESAPRDVVQDEIKTKVYGLFPGAEVKSIEPLPYPARPQWGTPSTCPPFCMQPAACAGHGGCQRNRSCVD